MTPQPEHQTDRTAAQRARLRRLVQAARTGGPRQLRALTTACGPRLWRVAAALAGETEAAELVTATIVATVVTGAETDDIEAAMLTGMCRLTRPMPPSGALPWAALPGPVREAFVLTQLGGLSYAETAMALDATPDRVRDWCAQARELLTGFLPVAPQPRHPYRDHEVAHA